MKPQIVHRYTIPLQTAIEQLLGMEAADGERFLVSVEGDDIVVDIIEPAGLRSAAPEPTLEPSFPEISQGSEAAAPAGETQKINTPEKPKGGPLAQRAGIICAEKGFWRFLSEKYGKKPETADAAADWLRNHLQIESRAALDHAPVPAAGFREVEKEYRFWLDGY
ncbi:hypothetical protein EOA79_02595 [Mesorhizobium sp. M1A.F.Ca.IN.020.03.2.1]|uniref:hypothetical protein n=1 Tax=Mesorhizobium sp. M1A.F.Ca.IN.020.03.2.1 TaxID=2496769 RepID=UPI000FD4C8E7|nr:hypothetical protein [Mesorhizobium sp. M1A.F.Ca.IN.020.03.2.1]RUV07996.1 hypothetical protein EOA79_02595 [Mesorhizobium sp. M1A.F.Ca.IN.020.03.2.1]